ncbi:MAG: hypothetical protein IJ716_14370 [Lachnospiraceae bacterium]|nr:hypothetical protein [Lachnospiraceae bacterium]
MKHELTHHGILGMKWGVRRYQNTDGTLTEAGKKRYYVPKDRIDAQLHIQKKAAFNSISQGVGTAVASKFYCQILRF